MRLFSYVNFIRWQVKVSAISPNNIMNFYNNLKLSDIKIQIKLQKYCFSLLVIIDTIHKYKLFLFIQRRKNVMNIIFDTMFTK